MRKDGATREAEQSSHDENPELLKKLFLEVLSK
jgi:hypothetical protein